MDSARHDADDDALARVLANKAPAQFDAETAERLRSMLTDHRKRRLFIKMEQRFKAWTGESFIGFTTRRAALNHHGQGEGSDNAP